MEHAGVSGGGRGVDKINATPFNRYISRHPRPASNDHSKASAKPVPNKDMLTEIWLTVPRVRDQCHGKTTPAL